MAKTRKISADALNGISHGGQLLADVDSLTGLIDGIKNSKNYATNGFVGVQVAGKIVWMDETDLVGYVRQNYPTNVQADELLIRYDNVTITIIGGALTTPVTKKKAKAKKKSKSKV